MKTFQSISPVVGIAAAVAAFLTASVARGESVRWAASATDGISSVPQAIGAPDGRTYTLGGPVQLGSFNVTRIHTGLTSLLGLAPEALAKADVIAFEYNGFSAPRF